MRTKRPALLTVIFLGFLQLAFGQGNKHALIFAIGNYPADSGWPIISSDNDTVLIKNALLAQQFFSKNIKVIHDQQATAKGISAALEEFVANANPGDIDVIHFSSHGEQIEDLKHHKADGLEECIVPYDAKLPDPDKRPYTKAYIEGFFPGYYREDMFGGYINKLRAKLGKNGDLIVFLDCCHAGTGTRGSAKIRGGKDALVTPGFNLKTIPAPDMAAAFSSLENGNGDESNLAPYVVFGAAQANESDYETVDVETSTGYGSLSYAISKAFLELPKEDISKITYRTLFAQIQATISSNPTIQHPVLAATDQEKDRLLFGGKVLTQKPFIEIDSINGNQLVIKSGKLKGLDSGARVGVYPSTTLDPKDAKMLDSGVIISSGLFSSTVQFNRKVSIKRPADGRVFVTESVYHTAPLKVAIASNISRGADAAAWFTVTEAATMQQAVGKIPGVVLSGQPELKIVKGQGADSIIIAQTGLLFDVIPSATNTDALKEKITRYMQYTFLKSIILKDEGATVDIKLIPVVNGKVDSAAMFAKNPSYSFKNGDKFRVLVTNSGKKDVYVNILDIQPDGQINLVLPNSRKRIDAEDLLFPAGSSKLFPNNITISPPYGKETFKIFVSTDLINMESLATTRGARGAKGNFQALEGLVSKSYTSQTRGVTEDMSSANGSVYNVPFDIVP